MDSPCRSLPGTTSFFSQPQLIPSVVGFIDIDLADMQLFVTVLQGSPDPPECVESLMYVFCLVVQPQCDENTGLPLNTCQESCEVYTWLLSSGQCEALREYLQGFASGSLLPTIPELLRVYANFNCTNRSTYYYGELDPADGSCANLLDPHTQGMKYLALKCTTISFSLPTNTRDTS